MTFNLTPKRIEALRFIAAHPGCAVGYVAQSVLAQAYDDGTKRSLWSQAATRSGAGYCKALAAAGLVTINTRVSSGYGDVTITPAGAAAIDAHDAPDQSLSAVLERCTR